MKFKLLENRIHKLEETVEELTNKVKLLEFKDSEAEGDVHRGPGRPPKVK